MLELNLLTISILAPDFKFDITQFLIGWVDNTVNPDTGTQAKSHYELYDFSVSKMADFP